MAPSPARRARPRRATLLAWTLFAAGAASSMACSSSTPPTSNDDESLPPVSDDSCARFGFRFSPSGCPEAECAELLCTCASGISCIPGKNERCMIAVDCGVACSAAPETLLLCAIDMVPCRLDADCSEGRCVVEPGALDGECESGERGARCRNDQDCKQGNCIAGQGNTRACSPGEPSDLCNRASDCQSEHCALSADQSVGTCED